MKRTLILCALAAVLAAAPLGTASAITVGYNLDFSGATVPDVDEIGSGMLTLDDMADSMNGTIARYDFTNVMGMGSALAGDWLSAFVDYESATGEIDFFMTTSGPVINSVFANETVASGLSIFEAFEVLDFASAGIELTRKSNAVPESGSTLAMLGMVVTGLAVRRRRWTARASCNCIARQELPVSGILTMNNRIEAP